MQKQPTESNLDASFHLVPEKRNFLSTKTYTHSQGLSCAFRQWRAESHCRFIHGYALKVELIFAGELDHRNWVQDFGGLKAVKEFLQDTFDHTTCVAADDPELPMFEELHKKGLIQLRVLPHVGCEKFADHIMDYLVGKLQLRQLQSVRVWEHEANSAIVTRRILTDVKF